MKFSKSWLMWWMNKDTWLVSVITPAFSWQAFSECSTEQQFFFTSMKPASFSQLEMIVAVVLSFIMCGWALWKKEANEVVTLHCADDIDSHIQRANYGTFQGNRQFVKTVKIQKSGSSIVSITHLHCQYPVTKMDLDRMFWWMGWTKVQTLLTQMAEHCDSPMWAVPVLCCRIWIVWEGIAYAQHCVDLCSVCGQNSLEPFERGHWHICTDLYQIIKSTGHVSSINFRAVLQLKQKDVA
jgi:hypothetical protein